MADKKGVPWLLLVGLGALVYFLTRDQTTETPSGYPYPVSTTAASLSPSAGISAVAPTMAEVTPATKLPFLGRREEIPTKTRVIYPTPTARAKPWQRLEMRPVKTETVTAPMVLGKPSPPPAVIYDQLGRAVSYRVHPILKG